jgi:hypothetical protein
LAGRGRHAILSAGAKEGDMADDGAEEPPVYPVNAAHLVRTTVLAHLQLSAMADHKASILMGATFVIFTIALGGAGEQPAPLPLLILGGAAFFSAVFAVLAILPATRYRGDAPLNLMFFGSFAGLGEEEYVERLTAQLRSDDSIYRTMARDIYQNGTVLARKKYRLLGYAYRIFLVGLTASFAAFLWDLLSAS